MMLCNLFRSAGMIFGITAISMIVAMAVSVRADDDLIKDLRGGTSSIKAVSQVGAVGGLVSAWKQMKPEADYKAIAYSGPYNPITQGVYGAYSAEQAIEVAIEMCEEATNGRCYVYAVGDAVVHGYSQERLADTIEAYTLKISGNKN